MAQLRLDEISSCCSSHIYERGKDYFSSGAVGDFHYSNDTAGKVSVAGSRHYTVAFKLKNDEILADCTCPYTSEYGSVCKHIVAALLAATDDLPAKQRMSKAVKQASSQEEKKIFRNHLESLSQSELIELIERFASTEFRLEVLGRIATGSTAERKLKELQLRLRKVMKSGRKKTSDQFLEGMTEILNEARGYWTPAPKVMAEILVEAIGRFGEVQNEYEFIEDEYGEEYYPDTDELAELVADFISALEIEEKFTVINAIIMVAARNSFNTFDDFPGALDELYTNKDIPMLVTLAIQAADEKRLVKHEEYYDLLHTAMSDRERETFLRVAAGSSKKLTLEYISFLQKEGKSDKAITVLDAYFSSIEKNAEFLKLRLELAHICGESPDSIAKFCRETLLDSPNKIVLEMCIKTVPDSTADSEAVVRARAPFQFFEYLEAVGRLKECIVFFERKQKLDGLRNFRPRSPVLQASCKTISTRGRADISPYY